MTDRDFTRPSEHEKRVIEERAKQTGEKTPDDLTGAEPGDVGTTPYEAEVEAERRGTTAGEVAGDVRRDEGQPLDSAYKPKTG
jgi:hypothetical protein